MAFFSVKQILDKLRKSYPDLNLRIHEGEAVQNWEQAVGPQIASHARALKVKEKILFVEVDHPIWKAELQAQKQMLIKRLNASLEHPESHVLDLFWIDPINRGGSTARSPR
jgi:predicted nucleic acid-binding Zn ribbon protein